MRKDIFVDYSEWLFPILDNLEDAISMNNYNAQEKRVIGHIAERLFNIYIIKLQQDGELKVKELQRTFVSNETFNGALNPVFDSAVPVVISFDDNYAISGGALINSIIRHADKNKNYDIVVLENKVSYLNKTRLVNLTSAHPNISLRFLTLMPSLKLTVCIPERILAHQRMLVFLFLNCSDYTIKSYLLIRIPL